MTKPTKRLMPLWLGLILIAAANVARAGTWTFNDLTEPMTVTRSGTAFTFVSGCGSFNPLIDGENCFAQDYRSGTLGISSVIGSDGTSLSQNTWYSTPVLEALGSSVVSDRLYTVWVNLPFNVSYVYQYFFSDSEILGAQNNCVKDNCLAFGTGTVTLKPMYETGGPQRAATVVWYDRTDTSYFVSELTRAPEPSSLLLLGASLVGLGAIVRRKIAS